MPNAIEDFKEKGVEAVVKVVTGPNLQLLELLRNDDLDLVVGRLAAPERMVNLSFVHLYSEPVRFVVRRSHPLLDVSPLDYERVADFPVIIPDQEAVIRPSVDRLLITMGIGSLANRVESVSTSFGRAFTSDTDAIWIISEGVVSRDLRKGTLVALAVDTSDTSGPVGLTTRVDTRCRIRELRCFRRHFTATLPNCNRETGDAMQRCGPNFHSTQSGDCPAVK